MADRDELTLADMSNQIPDPRAAADLYPEAPGPLRLTVRPAGFAAPPNDLAQGQPWGAPDAETGRPGRLFEPDQTPAPPQRALPWLPRTEQQLGGLGRGLGALVEGAREWWNAPPAPPAAPNRSPMGAPPLAAPGPQRGSFAPVNPMAGVRPDRYDVPKDPPLGLRAAGGVVDMAEDALKIPSRFFQAANVESNPGSSWQDVDLARQQQVKAAADAGMNIAGPGLVTAAARPGASAGMFGGRLARTFDPMKMKLAEAMEANGLPANRIWSETGYMRGADKQWMHEISDLGAYYKGDIDSMASKIFDQQNPQRAGKYGSPENTLRSQIAKQDALLKVQGKAPIFLKDVWHHPALFESYPELRNMPVSHDAFMQASGGYLPRTKDRPASIVYREEGPTNKMARGQTFDTLLHEVQHAIQQIEGFARGTNPAPQTALVKGTAANEIYNKQMQQAPTILTPMQYKSYYDKQGVVKSNADYNNYLKNAQKDLEDFQRQARIFAAETAYRKGAGEGLANLVIDRKDLTAMQAAGIYPASMMKTPLDKQKVEFNVLTGPNPDLQFQFGSVLNPTPREMQASINTDPLYHGSPRKDLTTLDPSTRGPLGPGVYTSPARQISEGGYAGPGGTVYELPNKPRDIYQGRGHRTDEEWFGFKKDKERLLSAADPEKREELSKILDKMWSSDGYPTYQRIRQLYGGDEGAQALFKKAGFEGISGQIDGPETLLFGKQVLGNAPLGGLVKPREFWRGENVGDPRRISTGNEAWDKNLFMSSDKDSASMYGKTLTRFEAAPDARILYEGSPEWRKIAGQPRKNENLLDYSVRAAEAARNAGYDAAHFTRQGDVGTVVFNHDKFTRAVDPEMQMSIKPTLRGKAAEEAWRGTEKEPKLRTAVHPFSNVGGTPISEMQSPIIRGGKIINPRTLDIEKDLTNAEFIFTGGDATGAGGKLHGSRDLPFETPVGRYGGPGYGSIMQGKPIAGHPGASPVWASMKGPMGEILNIARDVERRGKEPWQVYMTGGKQYLDSSMQMVDTAIQAAKSKGVSTAANEHLVKVMQSDWNKLKPDPKRPFPETGFKDEAALKAWIDASPQPQRAKFVKAMDTKTARELGFPNIGELRVWNTDPRMITAPPGSAGLALSRIDPGIGLIPSHHPAYNTAVGGRDVSTLGMQVPHQIIAPTMHESRMSTLKKPQYYEAAPHLYFPGGGTHATKTEPVTNKLKDILQRWMLDNPGGLAVAGTAGGLGSLVDPSRYEAR